MTLRIRSKWRKKERQRTVGDNAVALAYVIWQIALGAAKNLHAERFDYEDDRQRIAVIGEYMAFLVHVADRMAYARMADEDTRKHFMTRLATESARQVQRNQEHVLGPGEYGDAFIVLVNERAAEYAETSFSADVPGYGMLRALGTHVQSVMGSSQTNRWVIDQVMEIDAPGALRHLRQALSNLLDTAAGESTATLDPD